MLPAGMLHYTLEWSRDYHPSSSSVVAWFEVTSASSWSYISFCDPDTHCIELACIVRYTFAADLQGCCGDLLSRGQLLKCGCPARPWLSGRCDQGTTLASLSSMHSRLQGGMCTACCPSCWLKASGRTGADITSSIKHMLDGSRSCLGHIATG